MSKKTDLAQIQDGGAQETSGAELLGSADSAIRSVIEGKSAKMDLVEVRNLLCAARSAFLAAHAPVEEVQSELDLLKSDFVGRILSMSRAISVACDNRDHQEEADLAVEVIEAPAKELLRLYRHTCVRFRDTFPGNTRHLGADAPVKDWSEYRSA